MEIQEYLALKERRLEKSICRIRDFRVFDFNYIPEKPLMRTEVSRIVDGLLRYQKTGIANHLLVFGSRGSGKTLSVKYLQQVFRGRGLHVLYANCRSQNTSFKILAGLLGVRPRGTSLEELWHRFTAQYPGKMVLVLDEVDLLSEKDRNKDILYLLSRSQENYMAILLSNNPKFLGLLDESIRSTLQPEVVHFRNYSAPEIRKILEERARLGLARVDPEVLNKTAALAARNTNSDVRVAIKTLYYVALEPEKSVEEHFERARRDILADVINDLNDKNLLILKAAMEDPGKHVKPVYERYRRLSAEAKEEPFSYVYFYSNLSYMQSLGLILLVSTKVNRTYTNRIHPLFTADLFESIWQARFG
jgi:cell division control protein 6